MTTATKKRPLPGVGDTVLFDYGAPTMPRGLPATIVSIDKHGTAVCFVMHGLRGGHMNFGAETRHNVYPEDTDVGAIQGADRWRHRG